MTNPDAYEIAMEIVKRYAKSIEAQAVANLVDDIAQAILAEREKTTEENRLVRG